jgi:hypothetical protein
MIPDVVFETHTGCRAGEGERVHAEGIIDFFA